jgi:hypothetical protein
VAVPIFLPRFFDQENRAPPGKDGARPRPHVDDVIGIDGAAGDALNRIDPGRAQQLCNSDERLRFAHAPPPIETAVIVGLAQTHSGERADDAAFIAGQPLEQDALACRERARLLLSHYFRLGAPAEGDHLSTHLGPGDDAKAGIGVAGTLGTQIAAAKLGELVHTAGPDVGIEAE